MKKVLTVLVFSFMLFISLSFVNKVQAADEIIDLYPYDDIACLEATDACVNTKVGNSNWTFTYYGHRYHVIRGLVRYGDEMVDDNSDGWIDDNELAGIPYNAFASVFLNNTDLEIDILTASARTDITDVVHRKYAHFDELGVLQMFEDHISRYYIYNDGDAVTPDWRLASEIEIAAYVAEVDATTITDGDPSTDGLTRNTHIRMALDVVDTDGYVVEPLGYLKWTNADVDLSTAPESEWSTIIADDPNNLYIPAGWTVVTFGAHDRSTINPKTTAFIVSLPDAMLDGTVDPMFMTYTDQPAGFAGVLGLDDDPTTVGVNVVVDYESTFTLSTDITASWLKMFDDTDVVIHETEMLDYDFEIYQEDTLLETISYVWNETSEEYDASAEQTVIDTSEFGSIYTGVYTVENPEGDITESVVDIVIGVMPPKFIGVENRYESEDVYIDILEGIVAEDGYGNDVTDSIMVTLPDGFNMYNPEPGTYEIELEFTHHVHFDGVESSVDCAGLVLPWDGLYNRSEALNTVGGAIMVFTDATVFAAMGSGWGSVMVLVGADGLVDEIFDRYTWEHTTSTGTVVEDGDVFAAWQAAIVIEDGGFVIAAHGSTYGVNFRDENLSFDDPITLTDLVEDFDYDIVTEATYELVIDDMTNPIALIVNDNYTIDENEFDNVNEAILANIVAFDAFDSVDDLAIYVSDNGGLMVGTAGVYTVEVTVEDMVGNATVVEFDVEILAVEAMYTAAEVQAMFDALVILDETDVQGMLDGQDLLTEADVQAMFDDQTLTAVEIQALLDAGIITTADIQAMIDQDLLTETEVQDMIDDSIDTTTVAETGCGATNAAIPSLGIVGLFMLLGTTFVILRRFH